MKKDDVQITVSIIGNDFNIHTEGDSVRTVQAMMIGLAALLEDTRKNDTSDAKMEDLVLEEYRRSVVFVRKENTVQK